MERLSPQEIKAIRIELQFTQEELAHELGTAVSTVNRWENGKSLPGKMACKFLLKLKAERARVT